MPAEFDATKAVRLADIAARLHAAVPLEARTDIPRVALVPELELRQWIGELQRTIEYLATLRNEMGQTLSALEAKPC
jgi:hypothetical protein